MKRIRLLMLGVALTCVFTVSTAHAIELSLEENRAERGSVGYVDMQRLFKSSPDAARAKEGLEELVRQAEERVNIKKAELLRLRQEFGSLKIERNELEKSVPAMPAPPSAPLSSTLPSKSTEPPNAVLVAVGTTTAALVVSTATVLPLAVTGPTVAQRLLEFDGKIAAKQVQIDHIQDEIDHERLDSEHALLDAEGRKTDQVFARLYRVISEVAKHEGISVVVDKSAMLYGHPALDLTDKVLKQLRMPAQ